MEKMLNIEKITHQQEKYLVHSTIKLRQPIAFTFALFIYSKIYKLRIYHVIKKYANGILHILKNI